MEYTLLTQQGALQEGRDHAISDDDVVSLLTSSPGRRSNKARSSFSHQWGEPLPTPHADVIKLVTGSMARERTILPLHFDGSELTIACVNPDDIALADKLRFVLNCEVNLIPAPMDDLQRAIEECYGTTECESVDSMLCEFTETAIAFTEVDAAKVLGHSPAGTQARSRIRRPERQVTTTAPRSAIVSRSPGRSQKQKLFTQRGQSMFHFTVDEGEQSLMTHRNGRSEVLVGPRRVWNWGKRFSAMDEHVAHPGEFLIVRFRDGRQEHIVGPASVWFDERTHERVDKQDALQIAANEAVVVYTKPADDEKATRRVEHGPQLFVPKPSEWLHTFTWHASRGGSQGEMKVAKGLVFQKLWLMPDQMYHDVRDVRTSDDAVLTIRLMIFFELKDIDRMLDTTHDPIGDFVNAATADVVGFTGRHDFESFKQHTDALNELATYRHLVDRAEQCGYQINNVVYRGYGAPDSLQQMHDQAIEARTRLQLERATEEQAQQLEDFKLESQMARAGKRRSEQTDEVRHELELGSEKQEAALRLRAENLKFAHEQRRQESTMTDEIRQRKFATEQAHYKALATMGVELTEYLTQARADQVIELRGEGTRPHVHLDKDSKAQDRS